MKRINLFLKGNLDLRDSLHSLRINGALAWNGVNELLRGRIPGVSVRLRHETWSRSDALLLSTGTVPDELRTREFPSAYPAAAQFSTEFFSAPADALILSVQPDVMSNLMRHKRDGYCLLQIPPAQWNRSDRDWLRANFEPVEALDAATSMANLSDIVERRRRISDAPILIYNLSSVVPGDSVHCHAGLGEVLSTRIRRFNLGLVELSQQAGVSIVDVDAVLARAGADRLKIDALHLNAEGCRLVAEEAVRILDDLGVLGDGS